MWKLSPHILLIFLIFSSIAHAGELKVCYDASFLFKIGESCISYKLSDDHVLNVESEQETTGIIDLMHRIEQKVSSEVSLRPFESLYLFFYEKNEHKTMTHHYYFNEKIKYTSNSYRFKKNKRYKTAKKSSLIKKRRARPDCRCFIYPASGYTV